MSSMPRLFSFHASSASYRARIALNLKNIEYEYVAIDATSEENRSKAYLDLNPQGLIPTLEINGQVLVQSMAIIEYLDETQPTPALLPSDPFERARIRALAQITGCEMHPINNKRVREFITNDLGLSHETLITWMGHWNALGFESLEAMLVDSPYTGKFCHGDYPTMADVYLVPQLDLARRFKIDVSKYSTILRIEEGCLNLTEFSTAKPENQPDAPK